MLRLLSSVFLLIIVIIAVSANSNNSFDASTPLSDANRIIDLEHTKDDAFYANDIHLFSEANMRQHYIREFYYDHLPAHLKAIFHRIYPTKIDASHRKLQAYSSSTLHGLTAVSFWYGVDGLFHAIPIFGSIAVGIVRGAEDTAWKTLFFDAKLGKCLGTNRNNAAVELNERGRRYCAAGRFDKALEYYENAVENTVNDDHNVSIYLSNQANALISLGRLDDAQHAAEVALQFNTTNIHARKALEFLRKKTKVSLVEKRPDSIL